MSKGAGFAPAGLSPAGTGTVDAAPSIASGNLIDAFGAQQSARAFDPSTGKFILNANGRVQGMPRVLQLVYLRVRTLLNSSAVKNLGLKPLGGDNDSTALQRIRTSLDVALGDLVKQGLILILSVSGYSDVPTRTRTALKFRDLTTGLEYTVPL
jgi:hypothetical protein